MNKKLIREWKKVFRSDLPYIVYELKDLVKVPAVIFLEGEVGAGKTTFAQYFIGEKEVLSPTYSILSECKNLLHADFYRVEKNEDILPLEIPLYLEDKQYFLAEWGLKFARRIVREVPENFTTYLLEIKVLDHHIEHAEGPPRNFFFSSLADD